MARSYRLRRLNKKATKVKRWFSYIRCSNVKNYTDHIGHERRFKIEEHIWNTVVHEIMGIKHCRRKEKGFRAKGYDGICKYDHHTHLYCIPKERHKEAEHIFNMYDNLVTRPIEDFRYHPHVESQTIGRKKEERVTSNRRARHESNQLIRSADTDFDTVHLPSDEYFNKWNIW